MTSRRRRRRVAARGRAPAWGCVLALAALTFGGCGNTLQDRPISHSTLETLLMAPFPVYWLGGSFHRLAITEASHDPSGAFSVQYGDCKVGGQGTCVPPLRVVTTPDNSFIPGSSAPHQALAIRGVSGLVSAHGQGQAIVLPTAGVVVAIYALERGLALAAAEGVVPINQPAAPGAPLPAPLPDTGYAATPLPAQVPAPLAPAP